MATTLNDRNVKAVIADIPKKGFRTKFWREYRANACKGSGVAKLMDSLEKMGVPPSGDPGKANLDQMPDIVQSFSLLSNAMLKAGGKCGKLQGHSKDLCAAYRKIIEKLDSKAGDLARNADKIRQQEAANELRIERENEATDQHLEKLKKENEEKNKLVKKELLALDQRATKIDAACKSILNDITQARKEFATVRNAFKSQHGKEGIDSQMLEAKIDTTYRTVFKKRKIEQHGKTIGTALPKLLKEATSLFSQYAKVEDLKNERIKTGKALKSAQDNFVNAQNEHRMIDTQFNQLLDEVRSARGEGG